MLVALVTDLVTGTSERIDRHDYGRSLVVRQTLIPSLECSARVSRKLRRRSCLKLSLHGSTLGEGENAGSTRSRNGNVKETRRLVELRRIRHLVSVR